MNNKGFAISVILYSMVILIVSILTIYLGMVEHRYNVTTKLVSTIETTIDQEDVSNKAIVTYSKMGCSFKDSLSIKINASYKEDIILQIKIYSGNDEYQIHDLISSDGFSVLIGAKKTDTNTALYKIVTYVYKKVVNSDGSVDYGEQVAVETSKTFNDDGYGFYEYYLKDVDKPKCYFESPSKSDLIISANYKGDGISINLVCEDYIGFDLSTIGVNSFATNPYYQVMQVIPERKYDKSLIPNSLSELRNADFYSSNKVTFTIWLKGLVVSPNPQYLRLSYNQIRDAAGNSNDIIDSSTFNVVAYGNSHKTETTSYNVMGTLNSFSSYNSKIKEIYFLNESQDLINNSYNNATIKFDITNTSHSVGTSELQSMTDYGKVLAWLEPIDGTYYKLYIASDGYTYLST